jgi:RNA polymerase sigma-70 factor, ECF subfamily
MQQSMTATPPGDEARDRLPELASVYREHYGRLVRLAFSITGRRSEAEELVQESFLTAQQKWGSVAGYDDPPAWLRHVVVNRCLSFQRKVGSEGRALGAVAARHRLDEEPAVADVGLTENDTALWAAVRALPRMQAAVIGLVFIDDQTPVAAARLLGCSEDTVRTHLRRAKATLAARLTVTEDRP